MNLTAEQREIGRREFLQAGLASVLVTGGGMGAFYFGYGKSLEKPLRVGVIGTGDEGCVLIGALNPDYHELVAIADIRPYSLHRAFHGDVFSEAAQKARPGILAKFGWKTETEARKHVAVYDGLDDNGYYDLLSNKNVEAVIIALPLHLHARVAIEAMRAGKHVLCEKLMGYSVAECKEMALVAEQTQKILAVGHQRHYNILYDNAAEMIRQGVLGQVHYIRAQWHRGNLPGRDSWKPPLPPGTRKVTPEDKGEKDLLRDLESWKRRRDQAKGREIEQWAKKVAQLEKQIEDKIVDAARHEYQKVQVRDPEGQVRYEGPPLEELIRWRLWKRTGGGIMAELGSHQLDAATIFIAAEHYRASQKVLKENLYPLSVSAVANRNLFDWDREIEDHLSCMLEFRGPTYDEKDALGRQRTITVAYASINGNGFGGYGEIVFGDKGTLIVEQEKEAMLFRERDEASGRIEVKAGQAGPAMDTQASPGQIAATAAAAAGPEVSRGYAEELEHWAWCIRNPDPNNKPRCHPEVALKDAVIALTTNVAAAKGQRIVFRKEWFDYTKPDTPDGSTVDLAKYKWPVS